MTAWSETLEARVKELEKKLAALEEEGQVEAETIIHNVRFKYDAAPCCPYSIERPTGLESDWIFEETDIKKIVAFWRSCGANV